MELLRGGKMKHEEWEAGERKGVMGWFLREFWVVSGWLK